jgi:hypothetical protein
MPENQGFRFQKWKLRKFVRRIDYILSINENSKGFSTFMQEDINILSPEFFSIKVAAASCRMTGRIGKMPLLLYWGYE